MGGGGAAGIVGGRRKAQKGTPDVDCAGVIVVAVNRVAFALSIGRIAVGDNALWCWLFGERKEKGEGGGGGGGF